MQYGLEKTILPSFYNQVPPTKLTRFLNWSIKVLINALKETEVKKAQPFARLVKTHKLDTTKVLNFVNTYLDIYQIVSKSELMKLRDENILSAENQTILEDIVEGYAFDHPFDAISLKSDHSDYREEAINQIKSTYAANQIQNNTMFDQFFTGMIYWAIANYQTPEMLESKKQAILRQKQAEERRKAQEEKQRREQLGIESKEQPGMATDSKDPSKLPTNIDADTWKNVYDLVKNKNRTPPNTTDNTKTPTPKQDSHRHSQDDVDQESSKKGMNTIVRGLLTLTTTTVLVYGLTHLLSKK